MRRIGLFLAIILLISACLINGNLVSEVYASSTITDMSAKSYIVVDENGTVLIERNSDDKKPVASICKLMTALLTLEEIERGNLGIDDKMLASSYACSAEGSQAFLDAGQEYFVRDLLKSVIVASANDSAIVLAEGLAGSEDAFVERMNNRARELGMNNTLYSNSTGLTNDKQQYSTARDTAIIINKISNFDLYREDCKIWMDKLVHPSGRETELVNTNRLIKYYPYTLTGKTGFTDEAKYCLSSTAIKDNLKLCCVVLGCDSASDRFTESVLLYNHAYANFRSEKIIDKNIEISNDVKVLRGKENSISIVPSEDYYLTLDKNEKNNFSVEYEFVETINAPIRVGDILGYANIKLNGVLKDKVELIANKNIEKQSYIDILSKIAEYYPIIN